MSSSSPSASRVRAAFSASVAVGCSDRTARSLATIQLPRGRGSTRRHRDRCAPKSIGFIRDSSTSGSSWPGEHRAPSRQAQVHGGCMAEGGQQPQRNVPVAEDEAGRVQPGDDLGAERLADEVRRPALRRVHEHRERELERAVGQAAPVECHVAAVAEVGQGRQLGLVHEVHLGLRRTPPDVVALRRLQAAATGRCRPRTSQDRTRAHARLDWRRACRPARLGVWRCSGAVWCMFPPRRIPGDVLPRWQADGAR